MYIKAITTNYTHICNYIYILIYIYTYTNYICILFVIIALIWNIPYKIFFERLVWEMERTYFQKLGLTVWIKLFCMGFWTSPFFISASFLLWHIKTFSTCFHLYGIQSPLTANKKDQATHLKLLAKIFLNSSFWFLHHGDFNEDSAY